MNADNFFTYINAAMTQMFAAHAGFFVAAGTTIFRLIVALILFLFGAETIFSRGFDVTKFIRLIFMILACALIMRFYSVASPFGPSFSHVITDEAHALSTRLESGHNEMLQNAINNAYAGTEKPGLFSLAGAGVVYYFLFIIAIALMQVVLWSVVGFSYMATGLAVLLGPMFIPWMIFPGMEFLFWGWLKALLQYAAYQVVASGAVFLVTSVIIQFFNGNPMPWTLEHVQVMFIEALAILGSMIYFIAHVPSFTNSLFSGKSGESWNIRL